MSLSFYVTDLLKNSTLTVNRSRRDYSVADFYFIKRINFAEFSLIDSTSNAVGAETLGLLINNGGTVCDDSFSDNSADAICRKMGYLGQMSWTHGDNYGIQSSYDITLDNVACSSGEWSSCTYIFVHNCAHSEDVFLQCDGLGKSIFHLKQSLSQ